MMLTDLEFYERRAHEEATRAIASADAKSSAIHRELARMYRERCEQLRQERNGAAALRSVA